MEDEWKIPRPSLTSSTASSQAASGRYQANLIEAFAAAQSGKADGTRVRDWVDGKHWRDSSSDRSSSIASHSSGSLLLSVSQLQQHQPKEEDVQSVASSTHFTVVNGMPSGRQPAPSGYCRLHQVPILVITMTVLLFLAILAASLYVHMHIGRGDI